MYRKLDLRGQFFMQIKTGACKVLKFGSINLIGSKINIKFRIIDFHRLCIFSHLTTTLKRQGSIFPKTFILDFANYLNSRTGPGLERAMKIYYANKLCKNI
jgi:hypothetical protein